MNLEQVSIRNEIFIYLDLSILNLISHVNADKIKIETGGKMNCLVEVMSMFTSCFCAKGFLNSFISFF